MHLKEMIFFDTTVYRAEVGRVAGMGEKHRMYGGGSEIKLTAAEYGVLGAGPTRADRSDRCRERV